MTTAEKIRRIKQLRQINRQLDRCLLVTLLGKAALRS